MGSMQMVDLPAGTYEIEVWGATGGNGTTSAGVANAVTNIIGGYSKGTITLNAKTTTLYVGVGGKGINPGTASIGAGGFNGGGDSYGTSTGNYVGGSGGGASHVAMATGVLRSLASNQSSVIIVAGGGGGGAYSVTYNTGRGGGLTGNTGYTTVGGQGGTQTAGGTCGTVFANALIPGTPGTFGQGGNGAQAIATSSCGAGGGGWYGGGGSGGNTGSTTTRGGGGGSGYIGYVGLTNSVTAQSTEQGFVANPDASGNGYARIKSVSPSPAPSNAGPSNAIGVPDDYTYTGTMQPVQLTKGEYEIEVWGANGGTSSATIGGQGGYSKGTLKISSPTQIWVLVGERGKNGTGSYGGGGGGGSSDVRVVANSSFNRIIVAGGGGGGGYGRHLGGDGGGIGTDGAGGANAGGGANLGGGQGGGQLSTIVGLNGFGLLGGGGW